MNLKNFPKKLDSKTSCLRITVPENLDLALEGLIRKVLREQPKTDDIYSFSADYFETLLKIRDAAGRKSTAGPFLSLHDDEDAREMVKLANTFPKPVEKLLSLNSLKKSAVKTNKKTGETTAKKKDSSKASLKKGEDAQKVSNEPEGLINQPTPDLIKKLPLDTNVESQPKGNEMGKAEPSNEKLETGKQTDLMDEDEEFLKSDPIKELVEKELESEAKEKTDVSKQSNGNAIAESSGAKTIEEGRSLDNVGDEICTVIDKHNIAPMGIEEKPEIKENGIALVGMSEEKSQKPEENLSAVINDLNNKNKDENNETNESDKREEKEKTTVEPSKIQRKEEEATAAEPSNTQRKEEEATTVDHLTNLKKEEEATAAEPSNIQKKEEEATTIEPSNIQKKVEEVTQVESSNIQKKEEEATTVDHSNNQKKEEEATAAEPSNIQQKEEEVTQVESSNIQKKEEEATTVDHSNNQKKEEEATTVDHSNNQKKEEEATAAEPSNTQRKEEEATTVDHSNIQKKEEAQKELKEDIVIDTEEPKSIKLTAEETSKAIKDNQIESSQDATDDLPHDKTSALTADAEVTSETQEKNTPEIKEETKFSRAATQEGHSVQSEESEKSEGVNKKEKESEKQQKVEKNIKVAEGETDKDEQKPPEDASSTKEAVSEIKVEDTKPEGDKVGENQSGNGKMTENEEKREGNQTEKTETAIKDEDTAADEKESKSLEGTNTDKETEATVVIQETQETQKDVKEENKVESGGNDKNLLDKENPQVNETTIKEKENLLTRENHNPEEKPEDQEVKPAGKNEIVDTEVKEETINKVEGTPVASEEEVSRPKRDLRSSVEEIENENPISDIQVNGDKELEEKEQPVEEKETSTPAEILESSENAGVEEESSVKPDTEEVKTQEDSTSQTNQPSEEPEVKDTNQEALNPENSLTPANNDVEEENKEGDQLVKKDKKDEGAEEEVTEKLEIPRIEEEGSESKVDSPAGDELCTVVDSLEITRINEAQKTEEKKLQEEKQIKTIETHYYDLLKVPETVTKEYKVHHTVDNAAEISSAVGSIVRSYQVVRELSQGEKEPAPVTEQDKMDYLLSVGKTERPESEIPNDEFPGLMTPSSSYSLNLSEMSLQTVSEMFLDSEKQYSSLGQEETRYITPKGTESVEDTANDTRREVEEVIQRTIIPSAVGAVPVPPRDAEELKAEIGTPALEEVQGEKKEEKPDNSSSEDSNETTDRSRSNNSKSIDSDTPIISVEVKTIIETQVLDDEEEEGDKSNDRLLIEQSPDVEVTVRATIDLAAEEDTRQTASQTVNLDEKEKENKQNGDKSQVKDASNNDETQKTLSGEEMIGREGSSGESDTTTSSAATEIKRTDSAKRNFANSRGLLTTQSLDSDKRSSFIKTRSLSTIRHGVTDFEVWNTIEKELEEAATKIQSKFRGYTTRKKLRREDAVQITTEESSSTTPTDQDVKEEFPQSTGEFHDSIVLSEYPR